MLINQRFAEHGFAKHISRMQKPGSLAYSFVPLIRRAPSLDPVVMDRLPGSSGLTIFIKNTLW